MALATPPSPRTTRWSWAGWILLGAVLLTVPATAQGASLELRLRRSFGYSWGGDIQGSFLMIADGPTDLQQVSFFVDEDLLETAGEPPFQTRLHTGDYSTGPHRLWAEGTLSDSAALQSNVIEANFVEASASWQAALQILTPILVIAGLVLAASVGFIAVSSRRYRPGVYGLSGGAICQRCGLPMARHSLAPNLGAGRKLERCPHCGKWSRVTRAPLEALAEAEARLLGETSPESSEGQREEALRRQVDDSRFVD